MRDRTERRLGGWGTRGGVKGYHAPAQHYMQGGEANHAQRLIARESAEDSGYIYDQLASVDWFVRASRLTQLIIEIKAKPLEDQTSQVRALIRAIRQGNWFLELNEASKRLQAMGLLEDEDILTSKLVGR